MTHRTNLRRAIQPNVLTKRRLPMGYLEEARALNTGRFSPYCGLCGDPAVNGSRYCIACTADFKPDVGVWDARTRSYSSARED